MTAETCDYFAALYYRRKRFYVDEERLLRWSIATIRDQIGRCNASEMLIDNDIGARFW